MKISEFDYDLPAELIAERPARDRSSSRMLVMDRKSGKCEIRGFSDIAGYLDAGDCAVFNNTRVVNARLFAEEPGGGNRRIEIFLLRQSADNPLRWTGMLRPAKIARRTDRLVLLDILGRESSEIGICGRNEEGFIFEFSPGAGISMDGILAACGHVPLPPYIKRPDEPDDRERYQTVFAKETGAVAAPTAGLHFSEETLAKFAAKGVETAELTLHVGPGTFRPVKAGTIGEHKMHSEFYRLPGADAERINAAKKSGRRVLAVGTTVVRTLETCALDDGTVAAASGDTSIFLHPPYRPKVADMLLTNFHLPRSTLLMLVATYSETGKVLAAYELAKREKFRFYSYGDCMLLVP